MNNFKVGDRVKFIAYSDNTEWEKEYGVYVGGIFEVADNDLSIVSLKGDRVYVSEEQLESIKTPFQKKGYTDNSLFKFVGGDGQFELGEVIKLHNDDGSIIPDFKSVTRDCCRYCSLDLDVEYIGEYGCEDMLLAEDVLSDTEDEQPHKDNVNSPSHYKTGKIECIVAMEAMLSPEEFIGYLRGNIFKYQWRYKQKNGIEDLKKAQWYQNKLLEKEST